MTGPTVLVTILPETFLGVRTQRSDRQQDISGRKASKDHGFRLYGTTLLEHDAPSRWFDLNSSTRIRRKDASERRERLIAAAVELFGSEGFDVPLEKIASRAGVSRPTLYRNFPDREAVGVVVQQVHLDRIREHVGQWHDRDDAFLLAIKMMAERTLSSGGFEKMLAVRKNPESHTETFVQGIAKILSEPLKRAKAAGLVRQDFDVGNVDLLILMLSGGALARSEGTRPALDRAVELLTTGLTPAPRSKRA